MSGPKVASKAAGGGPTIPVADRKLIGMVKEVATNHSDEEIYAMLKECNRDPNDAAQRLLSQGNFSVVTRKRDRKKETGTTKDPSDSRQNNSGNYGRGGRSTGVSGSRGPGRGASSSRNEATGGRSRVAAVKENGIPSVVKTSSTPVGGSLSYSQLVQPKASFNNALNQDLTPATGLLNGEPLQETSSSLEGGWPASSGHGTTVLQGAWLAGSGHGTIADMLKGGARKPSPLVSNSISGDVIPTGAPSGVSLEQLSVSSMHMPALDNAVNLSYEARTRSPNHVMNQEIGAGGIQRFAADVSSLGLQDGESSHYAQASNSARLALERDTVTYHQPSELNLTVPLEEHVPSASGYQGRVADLQEGQAGGLGSQFSGPPSYHGLHFVDSQKENPNVDWNSQLSTDEEAPPIEAFSEGLVPDGAPSSPPAVSNSTAKFQELNIRDNHSVIIPDHIRVSDADCTMLSFGSFDVGFDGLSSNPNLMPETESRPFSASESTAVNDLSAAMRSLSTSMPPSATSEHDEQPISSAPAQNLQTNVDVNGMADENGNKEEEELSEPSAQHDYAPSYSVIDAVSAVQTSHYSAVSEDMDSRPRDVSAVLPQYDNSTYYSGVFRSVPTELDSRYSAFSQLAASGKLSTSRPVEATGQNASAEVVNAPVYPNSNTVGMPAVNNGPSAMSLPQHSMHPYATQPSGLPVAPFANVLSYPQYMPPGFSYMQTPYQHNYVGTSNFHQVPTPVGAGGMKYPVPQYKTAGGQVVGGMHSTISPSSLGYGGYQNSQPSSNLPATSGNTSTFDDAASQHYKDNTMYLPSQQVDGPSVWLQSQLAREAQGSSYYNVPGQSQPTRYSQTQSLLTHTHPAAVYGGNLYHPQQSGSSPSAHQLLQQQQALGSMGALGTQLGSYQQNQRAQPTWAPGPSPY